MRARDSRGEAVSSPFCAPRVLVSRKLDFSSLLVTELALVRVLRVSLGVFVSLGTFSTLLSCSFSP